MSRLYGILIRSLNNNPSVKTTFVYIYISFSKEIGMESNRFHSNLEEKRIISIHRIVSERGFDVEQKFHLPRLTEFLNGNERSRSKNGVVDTNRLPSVIEHSPSSLDNGRSSRNTAWQRNWPINFRQISFHQCYKLSPRILLKIRIL